MAESASDRLIPLKSCLQFRHQMIYHLVLLPTLSLSPSILNVESDRTSSNVTEWQFLENNLLRNDGIAFCPVPLLRSGCYKVALSN